LRERHASDASTKKTSTIQSTEVSLLESQPLAKRRFAGCDGLTDQAKRDRPIQVMPLWHFFNL